MSATAFQRKRRALAKAKELEAEKAASDKTAKEIAKAKELEAEKVASESKGDE